MISSKPVIDYYCYINPSGYSNAAKNYILLLDSLGYDVIVHPIDNNWILDKRSELDNKISNIMKKHSNSNRKGDVTIMHLVPPLGKELVENVIKTPVIWFYAWEGLGFVDEIKETLNLADHCVTFSKYQVDVYKNEMGKDNISYIPHVVMNRYKFNKEDTKKRTYSNQFLFLSIFEWNERKDPETLIKSYFYSFSSDDNVGLIIKTFGISTNDLINEIENIRKNMRISKTPARIIPITNYLSDEDIVNLYRRSDCYVCSSRGEGYGLPLIESLFCGVPVIVPDKYVDKTAYDESNSLFVKTYDTIMYKAKYAVNREGIWGQVSDVDLSNKMRYMYENGRSKFNNPVYPTDEFIKEYNSIDERLESVINLVL